ncbi:MAG: BolA family protein [Betaproteobacteria bacterium]
MFDPAERAVAIEARLRAALAPQELTLVDESAMHAGHEGAKSGGSHFRLHVVSRKFEGLTKVGRHRLVYDALHDLMKRDIHALAMTLLSPDEPSTARSSS